MPSNAPTALERVIATGIVPVVRASSINVLPELAKALMAGGIPVIEVTMTTPKALLGIERLVENLGDTMVVGVGTVLDAATCRDAIAAGAQFVVSPHFDPQIVEATKRYGKASVPGAYTPTEIVTATVAGADMVKVFPSAGLGPSYIRDLLAPLPHLRLIPTGGVDAKNVADWFRAGAICVGSGANLFPKDLVARGDWPAVTTHVKAFAQAVREARGT
jgi:2-dehydro-3-deoxyphosphogluconate aldolase / (4S)-4-hydroxy-2-oxoglutarate aldolase